MPDTLELPPLDEGYSSDILFPEYGNETIPEGIAVPLALPAPPPLPPQESPLDIYLREKAERDAQAKAVQEEQARRKQSAVEYLQSPDLATKLAGEDAIPADAPLNQTGVELRQNTEIARAAIQQAREKDYQKDFGWLGGHKLPGWTEYKRINLEDRWESLTPEQQAKAYDHYSNHVRKYYGNYLQVNPDKIETGLQDVLIRNTDLVNAQIGSTQNKLDAMGYGRGWKDTTLRGIDSFAGILPVRDNPGYESISSTLAGAAALEKVKNYTDILNKLNGFDNIYNQDGSINPTKYANAARLFSETIQEDIVEDDRAGNVQARQAEFDLLNELGNDPEGKVKAALEAVRGYNRIGQLEMTKLNPELAEGLSGKRILPSPLGAKDSQLSDAERIKKVLSNPLDFAGFTMGMALAQQADLLEENLLSSGIGALAANPLLGVAGSAYAAGQQEATLVASDIIQDKLREKGYDPTSLVDWQRAYDNGVVSELAASATQTGQAKGLTTAAVESGLENVFSAVLKRVPFIGPAASGLRRAAGLAGKVGSHATAGFAAAASGELAGQSAAGFPRDYAEAFVEGLGEITGTGTLAAQKAGITAAANKLRADKPTTTAPAQPTEVSTTETTIDDERAEVEALNRAVQPPAPPQGDTANAQEAGAEVPAGAGDVTAPSDTGVAKSASESASAILAAKGFTKDAFESASTILQERGIGKDAVDSAFAIMEAKGLTKDAYDSAKAILETGGLSKNAYESAQAIIDLHETVPGAEQSAIALEKALSQAEAIRQSYGGMEGLRKQLDEQAANPEPLPVVETDLPIQQELASKPEVVADVVALAKVVSPPQQEEVATQKDQLKIKRAKDFSTTGNYDVTLPNGQSIQIFKDPETTNWYETKARPDGSYPLVSTSTRKEGEARILKNYKEGLYNPPKPKKKRSAAELEDLKTELQAAEDALEDAKQAARDGLITEEDLQAYQDSLTEAVIAYEDAKDIAAGKNPNRRGEAGFLDVGLVIDGLEEAAVKTWAAAKDFASWSASMVKQFGDKVVPVLKGLWNKVTAFVRKAYEVVVDPVLPGRNTERGALDLRGLLNQVASSAGRNQQAITDASKAINLSYLDSNSRKSLGDAFKKLDKDYKEARKAGIDPEKSKALFDQAIHSLRVARALAWDREFELLKKQYPDSLEGKTSADFQSGKEVRGYVATNGAESEKTALATRQEEARQKSDKARKARVEQAKANTVEAQRKLTTALESPEFKALSKDNQRQVLKAMKYLLSQDPTKNTPDKNESIIASINNMIEGNFMGAGKFASLQRVNEFAADLGILTKKYGGNIPFFDQNWFGVMMEGAIAGPTKSLFKKEARLRATGFSHPELRKLWNKHFGNYLEKVQTENSQIQQAMSEAMFEIAKKYGLAKQKFLGKIKTGDRTLWNSKANPSLRRMQVAAMVTTWEKDSTDPLQDINDIINDVYTGIGNEKQGPFLGVQGAANEVAFLSIIKPAIDDGLLIQTEQGFQVDATPEVWHDYVMSKLTDNERGALEEFRALASQFEPGLKFITEFYYGKEWKPYEHYLPRAVHDVQPLGRTDAPELTATTAQSAPEGTALPTHGSVLHLRQRLGRGQYYGMDLSSVLHNSLNTAAYETTTAETRFALQQALKSDALLPFFGNNKLRRDRFHSTLKQIHQAELHQGTGIKQPNHAGLAFVQDLINTVSNSWMGLILGRARQFPAQFATPFLGAFSVLGPKMFQYMSQYHSEWNGPQGKKLYNDSFPDLLQRKEQIDPMFDRSAVRSVLDSIADISLNTNPEEFNSDQRKLVYEARAKRAVAAGLEGTPKMLARLGTNLPDYWAVQEIFPAILQDSLIRNGVIQKPDEFTPENFEAIKSNPSYSNALAEAKTTVSDVMGNANRFSLRPDIFVFRGDQNPLIRAMYGLMQTVTQYAGDRFVDFKDLSYFNKNDKHAGQIRRDAAKRMGSAVAQGIAFKYIAGYIGSTILSALATGLGEAEGLDEEEKAILDKINKLRNDLLDENSRDQAAKEFIQMLGGPFATNSIGGTVIDVAYGNALGKIVKADMDEKKEILRQKIKREKNQSKKADMELQLDSLIKYGNLLQMTGNKSGFSMGPIVSEILRIVQDKKVPASEADQIAEQYWKMGGPIKKPDRNYAVRLAAYAGSWLSGDIRDAERQIAKARSLVARARAKQLEDQASNRKTKVDPINKAGIR